MRILCLTPWFPHHRQAQTGNFILDSLEALADQGHEVTVLVSQPWRPAGAQLIAREWQKKSICAADFSPKLTVHVHNHFSIPRNYGRFWSNLAYRKQIGKALTVLAKETHCQIIHAHTELAGWVGVEVGQKLNIPSVVTLHGINPHKAWYKGFSRKWVFEYTLTHAKRVILVGESIMPFFAQFTQNIEHFCVVHNGFRMHEKYVHLNKKIWPLPISLISVSNLHEGKGIDLTLRALAKLKDQGIHEWTYKIIGDGYERRNLENLTRQLQLQHHVFFIGSCDHTHVFNYLNEASVFILPSYREAFGVAYLEAMACGLLTIGIEGQGPAAFIKSGHTGILIPPHDTLALVDVLIQVFETREKMQQIALTGQQYVHEHFRWQHHAEKLNKIYQEIV